MQSSAVVQQLLIILGTMASGGGLLKLIEYALTRLFDRGKDKAESDYKLKELSIKERDALYDQQQEQLQFYERQIERWEKQNLALEARNASQQTRFDGELEGKDKKIIALGGIIDSMEKTDNEHQREILKLQLENTKLTAQLEQYRSSHKE